MKSLGALLLGAALCTLLLSGGAGGMSCSSSTANVVQNSIKTGMNKLSVEDKLRSLNVKYLIFRDKFPNKEDEFHKRIGDKDYGDVLAAYVNERKSLITRTNEVVIVVFDHDGVVIDLYCTEFLTGP